MKLDELAKRIANHLAVEELEIKFDKIIDDSRLYPKEGLIVISEKYKENYIECAKSLTHEYRHVFQIYYANLVNDELAKLEIRTTNKEDAVINCFNNILRAADYIINFKPHIIKTPFMNQLECTDICGYSSVLRDLKNNILNELIDNIFKQYKNLEIYQDILGKVNEM